MKIYELINKLDEMKNVLYDLHCSDKYNIDLHQMGEDLEKIINQLEGIK